MPSDHAILSPSASKRWMTCAPSARLEAQCPREDTVYTLEGTVAHSVAETLLHFYKDRCLLPAEDILKEVAGMDPEQGTGKTLADLRKQAQDLGADFDEMLRTVHDHYVVIVYSDYLEMKKADPDAILLIEQRIDLSVFIPEGFGSADAVIIAGKLLSVYDLKYGRGVKVDASYNPQIMCYGLGALVGAGETYDIQEVEMNIIQPRLKHSSTFLMDASELRHWGFKVLRPAAEKAFAGEGDQIPGDHCRFCAVAPRCKALAGMAKGAQMRAAEPALMDLADLAGVLSDIATIKTWAASVEAYALEQAMKGNRIPGWKVVEGKSLRRYSDPKAVMERMAKGGFQEDSYLKPREPKTITELEKLLRPKGFKELLGDLVEKPQGKPTLAPSDDPREELSTADMDFNDIAL